MKRGSIGELNPLVSHLPFKDSHANVRCLVVPPLGFEFTPRTRLISKNQVMRAHFSQGNLPAYSRLRVYKLVRPHLDSDFVSLKQDRRY